jgi:protein TonB
VEDDVEIEEEVEIMDVEADQETIIEVEEVEEESGPDFFTIVEDMPAFPGGDAALLKYIAQNVEYPPIAKENGITGVVYVSYIVGKDGKVRDVKVVRGADPFLDKEAKRVVKTLSGYKPGKQRGKPVPVQFTIPIRFVLN